MVTGHGHNSSADNLRQTARSHSAGAASSPKLSAADAPPPCSDCVRPRLRPRRLCLPSRRARLLLRRFRLSTQLAGSCSRLICGHTLRPEQLLIDAYRFSCLCCFRVLFGHHNIVLEHIMDVFCDEKSRNAIENSFLCFSVNSGREYDFHDVGLVRL
jgi:hypothetical protein